jgi:uncharacterized protein (TIGR03790 family)
MPGLLSRRWNQSYRSKLSPMPRLTRYVFTAAIFWQAFRAWGGGSGLNVVVVVNQNSTNSVQLGNEYCEKRGIPPQNLFRMTGWAGRSISWLRTEFESYLRDPLLNMLTSSGPSNQVEYVLLSMDIPYRVVDGADADSTTSALFYGFKTNTVPPAGAPVGCSLPDISSNSFAFSELPFSQAHPDTAETNAFLVFMLTDDTLAGAQAVLDRGFAADGSFPTQAVYLQKTSDPARNVRFFGFDNAVFDSRIRGDSSITRIASDATSFSGILGLLTGLANFGLLPNGFVPGAFGDSLTSYGGDLFEATGQTSLLAFLNSGAAGSYGTVDEPCNYAQKFPDPLAFFYQIRGFSLAEAYYQSVLNPYQGLFVGEPLSAPFAAPGQADWHTLADGTMLSGQAILPTASFSAAGTNLPIGQVDLFIDGSFARTLTNLPPAAGNVLSVTLNGTTVQYSVPAEATLASATAGLAGALNNQSNVTQVATAAAGDRLELQSLNRSNRGTNVLLSASASISASTLLTAQLSPGRPVFTDTEAFGYVGLSVSNSMVQGDWLRLDILKTNGTPVSIAVTNTSSDTNVTDLCQSLMDAINSSPVLQATDGVTAADLYPDPTIAQFFLYSRSAGWDAAQIQVTLTGSPDLVILPVGAHALEDNLSDLRPRNHLYLSSGLDELPVTFALDTTQLPDGFHELTLVGYEGTSVRTQTRVSREVQIQNTSLSASLAAQILGTNTTLDPPFFISVVATTNAIATIELFSTGGSLGVISNQASASFLVPNRTLGVGLHPFYALVTDLTGNKFRTQTTAIRIIPSFPINIFGQPLMLSWSSIPGVNYKVMASTNLSSAFQQVAAVAALTTNAQWVVPSPLSSQVFYRVQLAP